MLVVGLEEMIAIHTARPRISFFVNQDWKSYSVAAPFLEIEEISPLVFQKENYPAYWRRQPYLHCGVYH